MLNSGWRGIVQNVLSTQYSLSEKWLPAESLEVYQDFMEPEELLKGDLIFFNAMFNF